MFLAVHDSKSQVSKKVKLEELSLVAQSETDEREILITQSQLREMSKVAGK